MGDKSGEQGAYGNLANVYQLHQLLGDFQKAIKSSKKCITISKELGDRTGEGHAYGNLALAYDSLVTSIKPQSTTTNVLLKPRNQATGPEEYGNLRIAYYTRSGFPQALQHHRKRLSIAVDVGDNAGEECAYRNLGSVCEALGDFHQAIQYHRNYMSISKKLGDRSGEGNAYSKLCSTY